MTGGDRMHWGCVSDFDSSTNWSQECLAVLRPLTEGKKSVFQERNQERTLQSGKVGDILCTLKLSFRGLDPKIWGLWAKTLLKKNIDKMTPGQKSIFQEIRWLSCGMNIFNQRIALRNERRAHKMSAGLNWLWKCWLLVEIFLLVLVDQKLKENELGLCIKHLSPASSPHTHTTPPPKHPACAEAIWAYLYMA